jgi:hypothetical protein
MTMKVEVEAEWGRKSVEMTAEGLGSIQAGEETAHWLVRLQAACVVSVASRCKPSGSCSSNSWKSCVLVLEPEQLSQSSRWLQARRPRGRLCPLQRPDRFWGPPNLLSNGYRRPFSSGLRRSGRKADHPPPTIAQSRKRGSIHPLSHASSWCST